MAVGVSLLPERFRDPRLVGRGGMAEVYCATDESLRRPVAVKVLNGRWAWEETVRQRFMREARAAARLSGEAGIVTIFDVGEWQGLPFIVMQYLPGGSLQQLLEREGVQQPARVFEWLATCGRALDYAHEHGVVHRDVKPSNLLFDRQGRIHVADFGVASAAGLEALTLTGTVIGTAGYLSPEQAEGREAGPASDRYGLAVVAYELLAGSRPFRNDNPTVEAAAHVHARVPPISSRNPNIPVGVDRVFDRALAKNPQARYSSCGEFLAALQAAYHDAADKTRILAPQPTARRRRPALVALMLLLIAAGLTAAWLTTRNHRSATALGRVTLTMHTPSPHRVTPVTVTTPATTIVETVTAQQPPPTTSTGTTAPPATPTSANDASAQTLALQGYRLLQQGNNTAALPLLTRAAQQLRNSNTLAEAYNDYNLALALANTAGCSNQIQQLLNRSEAIQGHRPQIDRLRHTCATNTG